ncbi:hypothetical protein KI387_028767, partial [Taxus chinensis]
NTEGKKLWRSFSHVVTLDTIFHQEGDNVDQVKFRNLLCNLRNVNPMIEDWELLMSRTDSCFGAEEISMFDSSIHLFSTNVQVTFHNRIMLKKLNVPVARVVATRVRRVTYGESDDDQLESEVLLCNGQHVMLVCNLWVEAGLVNGSLGQVKNIVYYPGTKPPDLPIFVVVEFQNYIGIPWDLSHPKYVPVPPVLRGCRRQVPLKMSWALTIHKSQGLTLNRATIDIGSRERQGLTFTAISRVKSLDGLRICPPFSYERYSKMKDGAYVSIRKKEEDRLLKCEQTSSGTTLITRP